jgi:hypothetical protein
MLTGLQQAALYNPEIIDSFWANRCYNARYDTSSTQDDAGICSPTVTGSIVRATTAPKFGSGHLSKPSGASYLTLAGTNNTIFNFGTGDFTMEYWLRFTSNPANNNNFAGLCINRQTNGTSGGVWSIYQGYTAGTAWKVGYYDGTTTGGLFVQHSQLLTAGTWYHCAYYRISGQLYVAINGVVESKGAYTRNIPTTGGSYLGTNAYNEYNFAAYYDSVRVTKGVSRYGTTNFVPPVKAWPTPTLA